MVWILIWMIWSSVHLQFIQLDPQSQVQHVLPSAWQREQAWKEELAITKAIAKYFWM